MTRTAIICALGAIAISSTAMAADTSSKGPIPVTGNVPLICEIGTVSSSDSIFDLGVLVNTTTGLLRTDLSATPKTLSGSFCNTRSTISIEATPMTAQSLSGSAGSGFSGTVDYTASASGWTTQPAQYSTGDASNPNASQNRASSFSGDVTVSLSQFLTRGGDTLRLVSDPLYQGTITVTLAAAS